MHSTYVYEGHDLSASKCIDNFGVTDEIAGFCQTSLKLGAGEMPWLQIDLGPLAQYDVTSVGLTLCLESQTMVEEEDNRCQPDVHHHGGEPHHTRRPHTRVGSLQAQQL